jgi:hypothetical protein
MLFERPFTTFIVGSGKGTFRQTYKPQTASALMVIKHIYLRTALLAKAKPASLLFTYTQLDFHQGHIDSVFNFIFR